MASTAHGVLSANTVTSVTVDSGWGGIVVINRAQEGIIWCRVDGGTPAVAGADSYAVLGAREFPMRRRGEAVTVKMLTDDVRAYSVEAVR